MSLSSKARFDCTVKVLILGDHSVGKSTLLSDMAQKYYSNKSGIRCINYRPNSHAEMDIPRHGKKVLTKIVDTGGQERFRSITASFYRGAQGCLLVFDAEQVDTFMNIQKWYEDLDVYTSNQPALATILVGLNTESKTRKVSNEQAEQLATQLGMQYHQVNMKARSNLKDLIEVIEELLDVILIHASRLPSITVDIYPTFIYKEQVNSLQDKKKFNCAC